MGTGSLSRQMARKLGSEFQGEVEGEVDWPAAAVWLLSHSLRWAFTRIGSRRLIKPTRLS